MNGGSDTADTLQSWFRLELRPQEISFDDPHSRFRFDKPLSATRNAVGTFSRAQIVDCIATLQRLALHHAGLDYLQVFENRDQGPNLWVIEDAYYVTALLPEDY